MTRTVLVTGATGFVGRTVCRNLMESGHHVRALVRRADALLVASEQSVYAGVEDVKAIREAVSGVDSVIHLAARVHQMRESSADASAEYGRVNVEATRTLAIAAASEGVGELIFASSVKAMGESNARPWTEADVPGPVDAYGRSKLAAEHALAEVAARYGMATAALRFPLVYGPGVKANMLRLFELVDKGRPLPLGGIRNARSLLYTENAAVAIGRMLGTLRGNAAYFVADGEPVSTPELIRRIAAALQRPARLLPIPGRGLQLLSRFDLPIVSPIARRLAGSLTVDTSRLTSLIGELPYTLDDGLADTAAWYRGQRKAAG